MLSFFPREVLDEIWDLMESVSEGFSPTLTKSLGRIKIEEECISNEIGNESKKRKPGVSNAY